MEIHHLKSQEVFQTLEDLMKKTLDIGQTSLTEHQFRAFRKLVMDLFAEGRRSLQGRCGEISKPKAKEAVTMSG
jgi:hypothetical protein